MSLKKIDLCIIGIGIIIILSLLSLMYYAEIYNSKIEDVKVSVFVKETINTTHTEKIELIHQECTEEFNNSIYDVNGCISDLTKEAIKFR